jgi:hypothetical protein
VHIKDADVAQKVIRRYAETLKERNGLQINTLHIPGLVSALASLQTHTIPASELKELRDTVLALFERRLRSITQELKDLGVRVDDSAPGAEPTKTPTPAPAKAPVPPPAPKPEGTKANG